MLLSWSLVWILSLPWISETRPLVLESKTHKSNDNNEAQNGFNLLNTAIFCHYPEKKGQNPWNQPELKSAWICLDVFFGEVECPTTPVQVAKQLPGLKLPNTLMFDYPSPQVWKILGKSWENCVLECICVMQALRISILARTCVRKLGLAHKSAYQRGIVVTFASWRKILKKNMFPIVPKQEDVKVCRVCRICLASQRLKWKPHEGAEMWIETCYMNLHLPY